MRELFLFWPTVSGELVGVYYGLYFGENSCDGGLAGGENSIFCADGGGERGGAGERGGGAGARGMMAAAG